MNWPATTRGAGLVRVGGPLHEEPVQVHPIASILNLFPPSDEQDGGGQEPATHSLREQRQLLMRMQAMAPDFFRPGSKDWPGKELVPEAVFSAFLTLGLSLQGWLVEREAIVGAGRTDLKLRHQDRVGLGLVEVKIWGRNDYQKVQAQITGYLTPEVGAAAVIMLTDREIPDWPQVYQAQCLAGVPASMAGQPTGALGGQLSVSVANIQVEHLLLRLPRPHR